MSFLTLRSFLYSLVIHIVIGGLLVFSFDSTPTPRVVPRPQENIIEATAIDNKAVEKELQRLKDIEKKKQEQKLKEQRTMEKKLQELQKKTKDAERKRKKEQQRLDKIKKQQADAAAEQKRKELALKKQQEAAEKKRKEEAAAEAKRIEAERIQKAKEAAEQKRKEEELKKKQAEEALKKQLAEEQAAEQRRQDQQLLQSIIGNIYRKVNNNFNKTGLPTGLECVLAVQTVPGGEVISVTIKKSSGNEIFDRRAITSVEKSSPLPLPADPATFNRLKLRNFNFRFRPED